MGPNIKHKKLMTLFILLLTMSTTTLTLYAVTDVDGTTTTKKSVNKEGREAAKEEILENKETKGAMKNKILEILNNEAFTEYEVTDGVMIAEPVVVVIMTLSVALVAIILRLFFAQTALDLTFIMIPVMRPMLLAKAESSTSSDKKGTLFISESAIDAVMGGSKSVGMGGGNGRDRTVGGAIVSYGGDRTIEFGAFMLFIMLMFTGVLGTALTTIFNMLYSVLQGFLNMFPGL